MKDLTIDKVLRSQKWTADKIIETRLGKRVTRQSEVDENFSSKFWVECGNKLKGYGYFLQKFNGKNILTHWRTPDGYVPQHVTEHHAPTSVTEELAKVEVPPDIAKKLLPHQVPAVQGLIRAIRLHGGAVDGSDMGSGKTYVAIAVAKILKLKPIAICPKAVIPSWHRAAKHLDYRMAFVKNYEKVRMGKTQIGQWHFIERTLKNGEVKHDEKFVWRINPAEGLLIFDECHKMRTATSQNCQMGLGALDQKLKVLAISGTMAETPLNMRFIGQLCGLHNGDNYYGWMIRNGCKKGRFGFEFENTDVNRYNLQNIHRRIYPSHGVRVRIQDIPNFPECQTEVEAYDTGNTEKISKVYEEMYAELEKVKQRTEMSPAVQRGNILAIQLYARQHAEMLKVPAVIEMTEDFLENGKSVVIFTNFVETLDALREKFKTDCFVDGRQAGAGGATRREKAIADFQADNQRVIVVNIQSGGAGISLHDLNGFYPRASIVCPTWNAFDLKQSLGRIHRAGAKSKALQRIVYASGTLEDRVCEKVRHKMKNIDLLNDGDLTPEGIIF